MILRIRNIDTGIYLTAFFIFLFGAFAVYSSAYAHGYQDIVYKQAVWFFAGTVLIYGVQFIPMRALLNLSNFFYILLLIMLVSVYFLGSRKMGAQRWFQIGDFQFQPSEAGKFLLICTLARFFSKGKIQWNDKKYMLTGALLTIIPAFLVLKQPDLGSSIIYIFIYFAIVFCAGMPSFYFINLAALLFFLFAKAIGIQFFITALILYGIFLYRYSKNYIIALSFWISSLFLGVASGMVWDNLKNYQKMRLLTFLDPEKFSREGGWQIIQSKVAVANGGVFGSGLLQGSQTQLKFLPEGHNDFIFSVISEEFGLAGAVIILVLFGYLFYRMINIAVRTKSRYLYLLSSGIIAVMIFQTILNISISMGMMPVTGLPLPFVSYGGSSMLINMGMLGIIMNIKNDQKGLLGRKA